MEKVIATPNRPANSMTASRLSLVCSVGTLLLLASLHILSPELDPSWRMVSDYASEIMGGY